MLREPLELDPPDVLDPLSDESFFFPESLPEDDPESEEPLEELDESLFESLFVDSVSLERSDSFERSLFPPLPFPLRLSFL